MRHVYPRNDLIGLEVGDVYPTSFSYFGRKWVYNVRSSSEENIGKSCLTYYKDMWEKYKLNREDIILDVGAHIGYFCIPTAHLVSAIHAYEPSPANYALLTRNIKDNGVDNIYPYNEAIATREGEEAFNLGVYGTTGHMLASVGKKRGNVSIAVRTRSFQETLYNTHATVVKMDAEGIEWSIFSTTMKYHKVRLIVAELHKVTDDKMRIVDAAMSDNGFLYEVKHSSWFSKLTAWR